MTISQNIARYKWLLWLLCVLVTAFVLSTFIINQRLQTFESNSRIRIAEQQALLSTIAETTARNGADSITESIVRDCPIDDRSRFDTLLGSLDRGLARYELAELEQLFSACGTFYAERKAVMVARLRREIEVYESYVAQLSDITGHDQTEKYQLVTWQQLVAGEEVQSQQFNALVQSQKEIIDTLLSGKSATSPEIITILTAVRETKEALLLAKTRTGELRSGLTAL